MVGSRDMKRARLSLSQMRSGRGGGLVIGPILVGRPQMLWLDLLHQRFLKEVASVWPDLSSWRGPRCHWRRGWCSETLPPPQAVRPGLASTAPGLQACQARGCLPGRRRAIALHLLVGCCSVVVRRIRQFQRGVRRVPVARVEADPAEVIIG